MDSLVPPLVSVCGFLLPLLVLCKVCQGDLVREGLAQTEHDFSEDTGRWATHQLVRILVKPFPHHQFRILLYSLRVLVFTVLTSAVLLVSLLS